MSLGGKYASELKGMENAVGIVLLRLADDEWSRGMGEKMLPTYTTAQLLAHIAATAVTVRAEVVGDEKAKESA